MLIGRDDVNHRSPLALLRFCLRCPCQRECSFALTHGGQRSTNRILRGNRAAVIAVIVIVLVVVTVVVIQMIQKAPMAGAGGPGGSGGPPQMPPAAVIVAPVKKELTQEQASVTGTLRALSKSDVAAQEAGAVASVLVDEGDEVSQKAPSPISMIAASRPSWLKPRQT